MQTGKIHAGEKKYMQTGKIHAGEKKYMRDMCNDKSGVADGG